MAYAGQEVVGYAFFTDKPCLGDWVRTSDTQYLRSQELYEMEETGNLYHIA